MNAGKDGKQKNSNVQKETGLVAETYYLPAEDNKTVVNEFVLLAFSSLQQFQILIFGCVQIAYMLSVLGNITIILLIKMEPSLQTPMYFFIGTFSALEVMFMSAIIPNLLANLVSSNKRITFIGCFTQLFISDTLGATECYLLAIMAFDRDLAVNYPLHYTVIMTRGMYVKLAVFPWIIGAVIVIIPTLFTANLQFCGPNEINHFFCDFAPLQIISCSDPFVSNVVTSIAAVFAVAVPFNLTIGFYIHIIIIILKIKTIESKQKSLSTCSSHLTVACLFYVTGIIVYVRPTGSQYNKFYALLYTVITPVLNPFIYTLRNKDVKAAMRKYILHKKLQHFFCL